MKRIVTAATLVLCVLALLVGPMLLAGCGTSTTENPNASGEPLLAFQNNPDAAKLKAQMEAGKMPVECYVHYEEGARRPELTLTDPEDITCVYNLIEKVQVGNLTELADDEPNRYVSFLLADGTSVGWRFGSADSVGWYADDYEAYHTADLWERIEKLQDEQLEYERNAKYTIKVSDDENVIVSCPTRANAGDEVVVRTMFVTDADVVIKVDGEDLGEFTSGGKYVFVMPNHGVKVESFITDLPGGGGA